MIPKFEKKLVSFIESRYRSLWIYEGPASVYVRKSHRLYDGKMITALDLANITIKEKFQGKGIYKEVISIIEKTARTYEFNAVFLENILNSYLVPCIKRLGYDSYRTEEYMSYIKKF